MKKPRTVWRELTAHRVDRHGGPPQLRVFVLDDPGPGGANHHYRIAMPNGEALVYINFQEGGVLEDGLNGVTHEALLAIIADRLRAFQEGPFPHARNQFALSGVEDALFHLRARTVERMQRGVEGKTVA